jgi:curved DNA-binding protein CbpA
MNHYEILEVSANASQEVIRAAYRSLMQRYHPDRNPGNTEAAGRALLVNQAYEVLSDASKRAAYDSELNHGSSDHSGSIGNRREHVRTDDSRSSWFGWSLTAFIVLAGWLILVPSGILESPQSELNKIHQSLKAGRLTEKQRQDKIKRIEEIFRAHPEIFIKEAKERAKDEVNRTIPALIEKLTVDLKASAKSSEDPGKLSEDTGHVLFIPILDVKVGTFDSERAIGYIERNKEEIGQKVAEKLASAKYEELNKKDAEDYLKSIILDSIGETTGTDRRVDFPPSATEVPGRYGAIDVLLPKSFSVR